MASTMVKVFAPANLPEGYVFNAVYDGVTFPVKVPPGGVVEGQELTAPFTPPPVATATTARSSTTGGAAATTKLSSSPQGAWKDGILECCRYGPCHPSLCCAWWCTPCAMAQVMTRIGLDWSGNTPKSPEKVRHTFRNVLIICVAYYVVCSFLDGAAANGNIHAEAFRDFLAIAFSLYVLIVLIKTRRRVREIYTIPQGDCAGCDDCCHACFCSCCLTAQLARQTADYDTQKARCCTRTGLADDGDIAAASYQRTTDSTPPVPATTPSTAPAIY